MHRPVADESLWLGFRTFLARAPSAVIFLLAQGLEEGGKVRFFSSLGSAFLLNLIDSDLGDGLGAEMGVDFLAKGQELHADAGGGRAIVNIDRQGAIARGAGDAAGPAQTGQFRPGNVSPLLRKRRIHKPGFPGDPAQNVIGVTLERWRGAAHGACSDGLHNSSLGPGRKQSRPHFPVWPRVRRNCRLVAGAKPAQTEAMKDKSPLPDHGGFAPALLAWYDAHARDLPWRVGPAARAAGERPDPYRVWLSEIMLQQTTVATVTPRFTDFVARWPSVAAMAAAPLGDILAEWAGLGYYARARNLHKSACVVVGDFGGEFPDTEEMLRALPGVGAYTAAAIAAIAFEHRAIVLDGNIERICARIAAEPTPMPAAKPVLRAVAEDLWPQARHGDFAQGLMDLGATVCRPKNPACTQCPVSAFCKARASDKPERFPVKPPRKDKPTRYGTVFLITDDEGHVLFERRPASGLLGGMLGLPGGPWTQEPVSGCPFPAFLSTGGEPPPIESCGTVRHTFTHFHLVLTIRRLSAPVAPACVPEGSEWRDPNTTRLPTLMKKALEAGLRERAL